MISSTNWAASPRNSDMMQLEAFVQIRRVFKELKVLSLGNKKQRDEAREQDKPCLVRPSAKPCFLHLN